MRNQTEKKGKTPKFTIVVRKKSRNQTAKQEKHLNKKTKKKFGPFLDLCVSSLRRGHANLLCIVPILSDVPEGTTFVFA
ncbi:hypothetical protein Fmac_003691 [Flemingia macrophylla]|uniref:Ribosomal protein S12 n=1 Tax=Flemingia macrophylla TaxID=520843 RepID=A0ABD1N3E4_9FABA